MKRVLLLFGILFLSTLACGQSPTAVPTPVADRLSSIPADAIKHTPADDFWFRLQLKAGASR